MSDMPGEKTGQNLSDANVYGIGFRNFGAPLPINCMRCRKTLTVVFLNEWSTVDIKVECAKCGNVATGTDLRAEFVGKAEGVEKE